MSKLHNGLRSNELCQLQQTAAVAARVGGGVLIDWRGRFGVREKNRHDLVTDADLAAQKAIVETILARFPDHHVFGEESTNRQRPPEDAFCWVIDPLDGTTNYVHGFPFWSVSIAVCRGNELLAGAIFDPLTEELFTAAAGQGASLQGEPMRVSTCANLNQALVAVSLPATLNADSLDLQSMVQLVSRCQAMRRTGSAALNLAYLAAGRLDAFAAAETHPWDVAAGLLLVQEAGGVVTSRRGGKFALYRPDFNAAATTALHTEIAQILINGIN